MTTGRRTYWPKMWGRPPTHWTTSVISLFLLRYFPPKQRANGLRVERLSSDYLSVESIVYTWVEKHESPAILKRNGVYLMSTSKLTGWVSAALSPLERAFFSNRGVAGGMRRITSTLRPPISAGPGLPGTHVSQPTDQRKGSLPELMRTSSCPLRHLDAHLPDHVHPPRFQQHCHVRVDRLSKTRWKRSADPAPDQVHG